MKHIFKKLHHHPNRANETPQQPPPPHSPPASDNRAASSSPAAANHNGSTAGEANNSLQHYPQQDYYTSEEEYQVQLALALSVSSGGQDSAQIDPEKAPIRAMDNSEAAADLLSRRYWRLAEIVTGHLGGPVRDANIILAKWIERSMELRTSLHTSVLPIGSLRVGLSRHRALLFKAR